MVMLLSWRKIRTVIIHTVFVIAHVRPPCKIVVSSSGLLDDLSDLISSLLFLGLGTFLFKPEIKRIWIYKILVRIG